MRDPDRERRRIDTLRRQHPELAEPLAVLEQITEVAAGLVPDVDPSQLARVDPSSPPLAPGRFPLDEAAAVEAFTTFLKALAEGPAGAPARQVLSATQTGRLVPRQLVRAYCAGDGKVFAAAAESAGADPELLESLAELAVKPELIAAARILEAKAGSSSPPSNRCPACGSPPELALIKDGPDANAMMFAVCRLCETEWPVRRILCLACGNEDAGTLSYLRTEGRENGRIQICDSCHHYLPILDARGLPDLAPAVERIALADLELAARERGALSLWP